MCMFMHRKSPERSIDSLTVVTPEGRIYTFLYCLNFDLCYACNFLKIVTLLISLPPYANHYTDYSLTVAQKNNNSNNNAPKVLLSTYYVPGTVPNPLYISLMIMFVQYHTVCLEES